MNLSLKILPPEVPFEHQWAHIPAPVRSSRKNPAVPGLGPAPAQCPSSRPGEFIPTLVLRPFFVLNIQASDFGMSPNKTLGSTLPEVSAPG